MASQGWCFTENGPKGTNRLSDSKWYMDNPPQWNARTMGYLCYTLQRGAKEGWHWQGYVQFKAAGGQRMAEVKKSLGSVTVHVEPQRGTAAEARDYCLMDEKETNQAEPVEHGVFSLEVDAYQGGQGIDRRLYGLRDRILGEERLSLSLLIAEEPSVYCRYRSAFEQMFKEQAKLKSIKELPGAIDWVKTCPIARAWNDYIKMDELSLSRKILWAWSYDGDIGKTAFIKRIYNMGVEQKKPVFFSNGGKSPDLAHRYDAESTVLINIPRGDLDGCPWAFIEQVKDGAVTSGKYQGGFKIPDHWVKVLVTANFPPDYAKLSKDRFIEIDLNPPPAVGARGSCSSTLRVLVQVFLLFIDWVDGVPW